MSSLKSTSFYNTGHPNSENNGHLIAYQYFSNYTSLSMSYLNKYFFFEIEPLIKQKTNSSKYYLDGGIYTNSYLNEKGYGINNKKKFEIVNSSLGFLFYNIGIGISNKEMWIGPGFHSSLSMSNNAQGFSHYYISSFEEFRYKRYGINFKYFISERKNKQSIFFHNSLSVAMTYYNDPTISMGFNRVHLSGGDSTRVWSINQASRLSFEPLFGNDKDKYFIPGQPDYWDPWDQLLVGFVNFHFPSHELDLYVEYGTDDSRANFTDLKSHWDHASGYILGFKKFSSLNNSKFFVGAEFISTKNSTHTLNPDFYRGNILTENFYNKNSYLYSTYNGRRWGAHSGSDSDDKILMFGLINKNHSSLISFNYERHGITTNENPEIKKELIFRHSIYKKRFGYYIIIEHENIKNFNFIKSHKVYVSNKIGFSVIYNFNYK